MKIHFCDLCNESVPQSELDAGRAFMRKGRVVCAKCDQLMTQHELTGGPPPLAPAVMVGAVVVEQEATLTPIAEIPAPVEVGAGSPPPGGHHHSHRLHARPQSSGSGILVALCAMGLTALSFYWLTERSDKIGAAVDARMKTLEKVQSDAELAAVRRTSEFDARLLGLERSFKESVESERKGLESRLTDLLAKQEKALAPLGDIKADIAGLKGIAPSTQRHEQELIASAQKLADLETRANGLESTIADLRKELESKASAAAAPGSGGAGGGAGPAAPAPGTPSWMGMVAQLESRESGERWVAVTNLGDTKDPAVAEYLLPRLKDVDIFVRMATARVLGNLGSPKAIGALIEALNDQDSSVREAAYSSLCTVSKKSLPFDAHQEAGERAKRVKAWQDWWKKAQEDGSAQ